MQHAVKLLALALGLCAAGACNLLVEKVPCQRDENCSVVERCREGVCVPVARTPQGDAGTSPTDAGAGEGEDAGPKDAGQVDAGAVDCRPTLLVTASDPIGVAAGLPLRVSLDHAALVAAGFAADGSDLELLYGGEEVPRVLDPASSWNTQSTTLWFRLLADVPAGATSAPYAITQSSSSDVAYAPGDLFLFADFFERPDSDSVAEPWNAPYGGVGIRSDGLAVLAADNGNNRPFVDLALPSLDNPFELIVGFNFARTGTESIYRAHLHLGHSDAMVEPLDEVDHFARDGAGVSLVWTGMNDGLAAEETLAADTPVELVPLEVVSGSTRLAIRAEGASETYQVAIDDGAPSTGLAVQTVTVSYNRFRLVTSQMGSPITPRRLEYLFVRPVPSIEPVVSVEVAPGCE